MEITWKFIQPRFSAHCVSILSQIDPPFEVPKITKEEMYITLLPVPALWHKYFLGMLSSPYY